MSGVCIFCGARQDSNEHVFPKWLRELFPEDEVGPATAEFVTESPDNQRREPIQTGPIATVEAGIVCQVCNTGWMSDMEIATRSLIQPPALGHPKTFDMKEQVQLATWAVKTSMTCEMTLARHHLFTPADRTLVRTQLRPPAPVRVRVAAYTGAKGPLEYVKVVAAVRRGRTQIGDLVLHTLKIGCLVLQVAVPPAGDHRAAQELAIPGDVQLPIFLPLGSRDWPPGVVLDDEGFRRFCLPPSG